MVSSVHPHSYFIMLHYASVVYAVVVCPSVCMSVIVAVAIRMRGHRFWHTFRLQNEE